MLESGEARVGRGWLDLPRNLVGGWEEGRDGNCWFGMVVGMTVGLIGGVLLSLLRVRLEEAFVLIWVWRVWRMVRRVSERRKLERGGEGREVNGV